MRKLISEAVKIPIRLPSDAVDWELYPHKNLDERERNDEAVKALNAALKDTWDALRARLDSGPDEYDEDFVGKRMADLFKRRVAPVLKRFADRGAEDSETVYVAGQALIDAVKDYYGIDWFTDLGDYF